MHFNTYNKENKKGIISECGNYLIIKGYDKKWEIYRMHFGAWYLVGEETLLHDAVKHVESLQK